MNVCKIHLLSEALEQVAYKAGHSMDCIDGNGFKFRCFF